METDCVLFEVRTESMYIECNEVKRQTRKKNFFIFSEILCILKYVWSDLAILDSTQCVRNSCVSVSVCGCMGVFVCVCVFMEWLCVWV
jgi:hypothetical protein